jgi:uncharacterized membrane protein
MVRIQNSRLGMRLVEWSEVDEPAPQAFGRVGMIAPHVMTVADGIAARHSHDCSRSDGWWVIHAACSAW